ncbi:uncharacterized protein LOC114943717 [Nylanderia fulva]|uniref:uncharacterized protein LOC114943717 n=1 Tax=Nylanderia fulva TaxID=613905 RepID=UPI0010FBA7D8|nr:uncharacterized protein LOC114943717 [Nylanderia fulva]
MELYILNRGTEPTFLDSRRQEVIDITIRSGGILDLLRGWRVSDEPSESDHRQVRFTMEQVQSQGLWMRNPRKTNWRGYEEDLKSRLKEAPTRFYTKENLETAGDYLNDAIKYLYEMNCPLESKNPSAKAPWWSKELAKLKAEGRRLFNRARNVNTPRSWEEYRKSQRIYKKAIVKAKRKGWRSFCSSIESAPEASRLSRILCKENQTQWGCLKLPNGEYTETAEEILRHLMEIYFPGFREDLADNNNRQRPMTVHKSRAWGLAAKVVYPQAVEWAVGSFEPLKAPGPDGIYPILLQKGLSSLLGPMTKSTGQVLPLDMSPRSGEKPRWFLYLNLARTVTSGTSHEVVGEALIRHGVQEPLVDWIEDMLVGQMLDGGVPRYFHQRKTNERLPTGGSLISSVVVLVIDDLLKSYRGRFSTFGYADDVAIVGRGPFLNTLRDQAKDT